MVKKRIDTEVKVDGADELAFKASKYSGGLAGALEAILITGASTPTVTELALILATDEKEILDTLNQLAKEFREQSRGFMLGEVDGMWHFCSNEEYDEVVAKFVIGGSESKLSMAALETLAIIAYRQPVSRHEISVIRGVNVDGVVRTLLQRELIAEAMSPKNSSKKTDSSRIDNKLKQDLDGSHLTRYVTTSSFLERMGIKSLTELEPLAPFLPEDISQIPEFEDVRKRNYNKNN